MDNQSLQRIKDMIGKSQQAVIAVGQNPSLDDMAAALSLYLSLEAVNKRAVVISASEPIVELSSLVGIDRVLTSLPATSSSGDLIVSFPYKEGEIEKVSYTIDNGFLNIVVKASEQGLSFKQQEVRFNQGGSGTNPDLLFVIGTPHLRDVAHLLPADVMQNIPIINIDNKEANEGFGNMVLVSPRFSSVSEQVADLLLSLGIDFDQDIAQNLMTGISFATNNFQDSRSSYVAFEIASILMKKGAQRIQGRSQVAPERNSLDSSFNQPQPATQQPSAWNQVPTDVGQQAQVQPSFGSQPQPSFGAPQQASFGQSQQSQPTQSRTVQKQPWPQSQPDASAPDDNPPADWLTPKVYKGSGSLS